MNIEKIIREEIELREQQFSHTISDLARIASRQTTYPVEIIQDMLTTAYRQNGDEGVVKIFSEMVGVEIQALTRGRYVFAGLGGGGEPMLESVAKSK